MAHPSEVKSKISSHATVNGDQYARFCKHTWIADTGTSCHVTNDDSDMYDVTEISELIGGAGPESIMATKKGKLRRLAIQRDGSLIEKVLDPVKYAPKARESLFCLNRELEQGARLSSDADLNTVLTYPDGTEIIPGRRIKTRDGWVAGVDLLPMSIGKFSHVNQGKTDNTLDINDYHERLGHPGENVTRWTAKFFGVALSGPALQCNACALSKARQKNVPKATVPRSTIPGERLFIDISSPSVKSIGGSRHWLLVLDDATDLPFSFFMSHKDMLKTKLVPFIRSLKADGIDVKIIRCDNAGENVDFQRACEREGFDLAFEYTATATPQQNGRCERKFQTLYGRVRSMLEGSGIEMPIRKRLWTEAAGTATDLDGVLVKEKGGNNAFQNFFRKGKRCSIDHVKKFGELCVVTDRVKIKAKLANRGKNCYWIGYAKNHPVGTYRIYNPVTRRVIQSRDVVFMEQGKLVTPQVKTPENENDDEDSYDSDNESLANLPGLVRQVSSSSSEDIAENFEQPITQELNEHQVSDHDSNLETSLDDLELQENHFQPESPSKGRINIVRELKGLETSYNPEATRLLEQQQGRMALRSSSSKVEARSMIAGRGESETSDLCNYLTNLSLFANETEIPKGEIPDLYFNNKFFNFF